MKETSKKLHKLWLIAAMALLITVFLEPANVKAAQPPTDLKQTSASTRSVGLPRAAHTDILSDMLLHQMQRHLTTKELPETRFIFPVLHLVLLITHRSVL